MATVVCSVGVMGIEGFPIAVQVKLLAGGGDDEYRWPGGPGSQRGKGQDLIGF